MALTEKRSVAAARWLVVVIGAVTLAFLLETAVTQRLEGTIEDRAGALVANAMPSVRILTQALGELDQIDFDLDQYAGASEDDRSELRDRVLADEHEVETLVGSYALLPLFPHEAMLAAPVKPQLLDFKTHLLELAATTPRGSVIMLHHELDMVQASLRSIVEFDAAQGQRLGLEIERIRGQTRGLVAALDGVCVVLAVLAAILAVRVLRRAMRAYEAARIAGEKREAELSHLAEALGQFSGRVAHDILSPLGSALLSLEMLQRGAADDPLTQRTAALGIRAVNRVQALVDGLLAFSRAGGKPEPGVSTQLGPTITALIDDLREGATKEGIALELSLPADGAVACSAGVLTSLISNLVRNAIRYMNNASTRRIDVRVIDRGTRWRIEVHDTGPGIPSDEQARIFEPHVRLVRGGQGIGLGLATVDRLVRAHGGSLGVISKVGDGALFWFELPKPVVEAQPVSTPAKAGELSPVIA
jgi:signal transduction histidine kinase